MELNKKQKMVVDYSIDWYNNRSEQIMQFSGSAGTGKSYVLNCIIDALGIKRHRIAPMSFIGAAAIVMRLKGLYNAKTIHSWLFNPIKTFSQNKSNDYFDRPYTEIGFEPKPLDNIDLIIIDEAGAVPFWLKYHIESRGIKIIACGDLDQLPPVGDKPAYLYDGDVLILDEIMRQSKHSSIVYLSQRAKMGLPIHKGIYNNCIVIDDDELTNEMIMSSDIIICGKNATRDKMNKRVRDDIFRINSDLPILGEKVMCRKNNWRIESDGIGLANGLIGSVTNYPDVGGFDGKTFKIDFVPDMFNSPFKNIICDYNYFVAPYNMKDKYNKYNIGEKFEFAYAITGHLSQGSQYCNGIYMEEFLNPQINNNLNYVGITRFSNYLIYVKRKRKFY